METFLERINQLMGWMYLNPWDAADVGLMMASALIVFFCRYEMRRDSIVGTVLFICWIYQIYETVMGKRVSASSDVVFDGALFIVIFSAGGNIMSVVVIRHFIEKLKSLWLLIKRPFAFLKVK
ncbi:TPA: hypothetical protein ACORC2_003943 [Providencia stuartii]|uniref:hypothetical protein n=1 Tax=Morganellaceae TaxID=1903414 RepID=UPI001BAFC6A1|nr:MULTISPECIES: hypothetical protein [Morganellaceae]MBS3855518.1 hypothetical protein [Proteus mirabilis]